MANGNGNGTNTGRVESVTGVVIDAVFDEDLPEIYSALEIQLRSGGDDGDGSGGSGGGADDHEGGGRALVEYEPDPEEILGRLVPEYVEISVYRALLESTASEHGARMTAMRNASENAGTVIDDLTLEMNRARQAEITQEIMEVVAGAESLT